jgi:hypothetical protein
MADAATRQRILTSSAGQTAVTLPVDVPLATASVWSEFSFQKIHRFEKGFSLGGVELGQDAGDGAGGAVQPLPDQFFLSGSELHEGATAVPGVWIPLDEASAVQVRQDIANSGEREAKSAC